MNKAENKREGRAVAVQPANEKIFDAREEYGKGDQEFDEARVHNDNVQRT